MERRAQAACVGLSAFLSHRAPINPDLNQVNKKLNSTLLFGPRPQFVSRYSEPNHSVKNGSIITLVTGGKFHGPHSRQDDGRGLGFGGFGGKSLLGGGDLLGRGAGGQ